MLVSKLLFALAVGVHPALSASESFYSSAPFDIGNGDSFGIPGNATFDYVVVGGGAAGLAVAMRLAEDNTHTVAVVEAGGFYQIEAGNKSVTPAYNPQFANIQQPNADPLVDWGYVTTPQPGANNRTLHYARGKTLGGSSALNANVYNRGTVASYQEWANLVGDDSYTFEQWLPFFAKGVNYTVPNEIRAANATVPTPEGANVAEFSSSGGPLHVSHSNFALPFSSWAQRAFQCLGFANISSFSGGQLLGSQYVPQALRPVSNERESSSTSYLQTALDSNRTNLRVYTHTLALQVLLSNMTATGVLVRSGRLDYVLSARKEVILSAGAFQSPQLLMVSGIGPAAQLQEHGIPVLIDRPGVGQNMWDHIDLEVTYQVDVVGFNTLKNQTYNQEQLDGFHAIPAVSMYGSYGADYIGWEKLPSDYRANLTSIAREQLAVFPSDWPEIEYEVASIYTTSDTQDFSGYGTFVVIPVSPLSRGTVSLQSASMLDPPIIDPQWLTSDTDMELAIQALRRAREIMASPALAPIRLGSEIAPGDDIETDAQLEEYIRNTFFMNWHASCTCRMGRVNDTMAVVDSKARVIGVNGLRVVDASAFALLPPGHPISTVYGLAEKISADIIASR
ncbi:GMC oxidoreductase [Aureobasidium subglaciale EXF-2481]|uniref:GMC oxidoreductase n=1 Tax=Aureobasidium subglaciale (strain EXF-2481) TaxID=1043005 RepID=A0A074YMG2_AURSE|nr:GMC oxidoreductase [Aureobasidium subglaciale EXF-2481]KEQ97259.1 GMC oxidoreductase [Aureobasidium subglaciale EXF-2481]